MEETRTNTMETVNNANMKEGTNTMNENTIENNATMIETINKYEKETEQGYEVITLDYNFTPYTILKRETTYPYIVAYQYNVATGTWAQGHYDFESVEACEIFIEKKTHDNTLYGLYKVSFELPNNIICTSYIGAHGTDKIIEYFENIEDAKNVCVEYVTEREQLKLTNEHINNLESRDELIDKAVDVLESNHDLFESCVDILDNYNGFASDFRLYDMYDLDEQLSDKTPSEIIEMVADTGFDTNDDYFCYDGYDIYSVCDKYDHYINHTDEQEVIDNLLSNLSGIRSDLRSLDSDLLDLLEQIDEM